MYVLFVIYLIWFAFVFSVLGGFVVKLAFRVGPLAVICVVLLACLLQGILVADQVTYALANYKIRWNWIWYATGVLGSIPFAVPPFHGFWLGMLARILRDKEYRPPPIRLYRESLLIIPSIAAYVLAVVFPGLLLPPIQSISQFVFFPIRPRIGL